MSSLLVKQTPVRIELSIPWQFWLVNYYTTVGRPVSCYIITNKQYCIQIEANVRKYLPIKWDTVRFNEHSNEEINQILYFLVLITFQSFKTEVKYRNTLRLEVSVNKSSPQDTLRDQIFFKFLCLVENNPHYYDNNDNNIDCEF